jgi:hypothetical protein
VFNYVNLHLYHYAGNNPVKYVDPDGEFAATPWTVASIVIGVASLANNIEQGNTRGIVVDSLGIVADVAALFTGAPGVAGTAIKAARIVSDAAHVLDGANKAITSAKDGNALGVAAGVAEAVSPVLNYGAGKAFESARGADRAARNAVSNDAIISWSKAEEVNKILGNIASGVKTGADAGVLANDIKNRNSQQQQPPPPPSQTE